MGKISEVEVARPIVKFLKDAGWEVFQEVVVYGATADIIAKNGKLLWAIETKTTLNLAVIGQAFNWRDKCHFCSVGVPKGRHGGFTYEVLKKFGIGCIEVSGYEYGQMKVCVEVDSPYYRKVNSDIVYKSLREEQKTFAEAGNNSRTAWTPFRATVNGMINAVTNNPGIEFGELIKFINHHYSSYSAARNTLKGWIENGVIKDIVLVKENKKLKCFLKKYLKIEVDSDAAGN